MAHPAIAPPVNTILAAEALLRRFLRHSGALVRNDRCPFARVLKHTLLLLLLSSPLYDHSNVTYAELDEEVGAKVRNQTFFF